jgi:hypothetical protein
MAGHEIGFEEPPQACRLISGLVHNKAGFAAFEVGAGSIRASPAWPQTKWPGSVEVIEAVIGHMIVGSGHWKRPPAGAQTDDDSPVAASSSPDG